MLVRGNFHTSHLRKNEGIFIHCTCISTVHHPVSTRPPHDKKQSRQAIGKQVYKLTQ